MRDGVKVKIGNEILSESAAGFDDGLQRAVKENRSTTTRSRPDSPSGLFFVRNFPMYPDLWRSVRRVVPPKGATIPTVLPSTPSLFSVSAKSDLRTASFKIMALAI